MNQPKSQDLPTFVYVAIGCLFAVGIIVGIILFFKFVHGLIPKFGWLVPLGLLSIIIWFLKVTKKTK
jgi:hypothetical protein